MAVSFIPIAGPLISCIIDGTFVDMWAAICAGDWKAIALTAAGIVLAGVGVGYGVSKILKTVKTGKAISAVNNMGGIRQGPKHMKNALSFGKSNEGELTTFAKGKLNTLISEGGKGASFYKNEGNIIVKTADESGRSYRIVVNPAEARITSCYYDTHTSTAPEYWESLTFGKFLKGLI